MWHSVPFIEQGSCSGKKLELIFTKLPGARSQSAAPQGSILHLVVEFALPQGLIPLVVAFNLAHLDMQIGPFKDH